MTKQTKKTAIIISVILVIGIISYFVFFRKKKTEAELEEENKNTTGVKTSVFPLRKGITGTEVKNLQKYLNFQTKPPKNSIAEDGIFGEETKTRLNEISGSKTMSEAAYFSLVMKYIGTSAKPVINPIFTESNNFGFSQQQPKDLKHPNLV